VELLDVILGEFDMLFGTPLRLSTFTFKPPKLLIDKFEPANKLDRDWFICCS
jgi:hypothetical protein